MVTSTGVWSVAPNVLSGRLFAPLWTTSVQREATVWSLCAGSCHPSDPWSALQQVVFVAEVRFVKCRASVNPWSFWVRMQVFFQFFSWRITHFCTQRSQVVIHVASRRQPPAPHRWAAARNCQWCRPLRPKTSESTDCRKKNAKNLIAMYSGPTQFKK